jgi:hypothetical protein
MPSISSDNLDCIIEPCNEMGSQLISVVTDVDSVEFDYYRVCGKHYDELMTEYYDNDNNTNQHRYEPVVESIRLTERPLSFV